MAERVPPTLPLAAIDRLRVLERAIEAARICASRASEIEIDLQLGELHATIVERRRRMERRVP